MTKTLNAKKLTFFLAVLLVISCMTVLALAATVTTVPIWQPDTGYQAPGNTVYMYSDTNAERLAWKTLSEDWNLDILDDGECRAARHTTSTDNTTSLLYSYTFDAGAIDQDLVEVQPYYLYIQQQDIGSDEINLTLGCRTIFPVPMKIKVPTEWVNQDVAIAYEDGSCDGYIVHQATTWAEVMASGGDEDYLDGLDLEDAEEFFFFNPPTDLTTDADGYVEFTTHHGGRYTITQITQ